MGFNLFATRQLPIFVLLLIYEKKIKLRHLGQFSMNFDQHSQLLINIWKERLEIMQLENFCKYLRDLI